MGGDISDASQRLDDMQQALNDADMNKKKLSVEKGDLEKQIEEADNTLRSLSKLKTSLNTQVQYPRIIKHFSFLFFMLRGF